MSRVRTTRTRKLSKGKVLVKGKGGLRKIACLKCKTGMASPVKDNSGNPAYKCGSCGATFRSLAF